MVGGYAVYHVIRLAVDYFHATVAGAVLLALFIPAAASAQEQTPVEGQHGAAYVSRMGYIAAFAPVFIGSISNSMWIVAVPGTGAVLHRATSRTRLGAHVGPTGAYQIGPITVFGRHLFLVGADHAAAAAIGNKTGGGIEIPLAKGSRCCVSACTITRTETAVLTS